MSVYVYSLAGGKNGTIYTGMTDDLYRGMSEHKEMTFAGFTKKYGCDKLIEKNNPTWDDLSQRLFG